MRRMRKALVLLFVVLLVSVAAAGAAGYLVAVPVGVGATVECPDGAIAIPRRAGVSRVEVYCTEAHHQYLPGVTND